MCRGFIIGGVIAALLGIAPGWAQTPKIKLPPAGAQMKLNKPPKMVKIAPKIKVVPPAVAARRALAANPGAKVIKAVRLPNGDNVITLKLPNAIRKVVIPRQ